VRSLTIPFGSPCLSMGWLSLLNCLWMFSGLPSIFFRYASQNQAD
jgi:hypothetical protein